jgi:hypothetical protein
VIAATELLPAIFKNEWDAQNAQFRRAPRGVLGRSLSGLKSVLTGDEKRDYTPPNRQRLSIFMDDALGFVAPFAVAYRWALRRGGQAANRTSRKLEQS